MLQKHIGYLFITIAVLELSLLPILSSTGAATLGTVPLLFLTFLTGTIVSAMLVLYKKRTKALVDMFSKRNAILTLSISGLLNFAIAQAFLTLGVLGANPIIASLVLKLWPIFMALMLPFVLRTKVKPAQFIALTIGFLGVYILITNGTLAFNGDVGLAIAVLLIVASTLATASSNVIIRARNYDMYVQIFIFNLMSFLFFAFLFIGGNQFQLLHNLTSSDILSFLFLGGITYSIGAFMFFYALKVLNPVFVANATYATPFLTIALSSLLLGTKLYDYYFYAAGLILVALLIQRKYATTSERYAGGKTPSKNNVLFDVTGVFVNNTGKVISASIEGNGRAMAIKMEMKTLTDIGQEQIKSNRQCILFSTADPHSEVRNDEINYVNEIVGIKENEVAIIGIGNEKEVEGALTELTSKESFNV